MRRLLPGLCLLFTPAAVAWASPGLTAFTVTPAADGGETYSVTIQILALMTLLSLLPAALIMTTSFTRIIIVLRARGGEIRYSAINFSLNLRLAAVELSQFGTPPAVACSEAVELANRYSDEQGRRMINGVLRRYTSVGAKG